MRNLTHTYLTESVLKVVFQTSIPPQIHQLILHYQYYRELVDEFVRDLTFAERLYKHFL